VQEPAFERSQHARGSGYVVDASGHGRNGSSGYVPQVMSFAELAMQFSAVARRYAQRAG
jgi:hypothetical protein